MSLAKFIAFATWIIAVYQMVCQPVIEEWNSAQGLSGRVFVLESYLPVIVVPAISYIKAFVQKEKRDSWANFLISGFVLFVILAVVFSIHQYGLFNITTSLEYFAKNWFGIYLFTGLAAAACIFMVKVIEFIGA